MHMWVIHVGKPNVTGEEKIFGPDPAEDRTLDPLHVKQTLYHVAIKAGFYSDGVSNGFLCGWLGVRSSAGSAIFLRLLQCIHWRQ